MTTQNICNICGANYEYRDGKWRCPACGAYKPEEISNEEGTLLYNAAQKLRLSAFDDAEELYRDIVSQYPKNSRGYWGLVLAKYGIKYERDYDGKMVPSCYAASYESIFGDENYKKALQYADKYNRSYYEAQAKRIEDVRRRWIEIAEREEPYDIFISYKDSDKENGIDRTDDSRDAYELYSKLKEKGYRVFYSRESLAGKEGEKFEPYIFNALNTAQAMIVYGTKPEYIESTWVKNEWMRYYKRIKRGEKQENSLILAYKGFNPSKLPKPLCDIQGIDLGRITVGIGDLELKISEILNAARMRQKIARVSIKGREKREAEHIRRLDTVEVGKVISAAPKGERERIATRTIGGKSVKLSVNAEKSLSVAESYLSRGQFAEAEERFDEILRSSPRNGRALTGKLLAQSNVQELSVLERSGFVVIPQASLVENVLSNAEENCAEIVLNALCREASKSFERGDVAQAKFIVSIVKEYAGAAVDKLRGELFERGLRLTATDEESAKYFLDINLSFEENEEKYIRKLHAIVNNTIKCSAFALAEYYVDKLKEDDPNSYETHVAVLEIEYKTNDAAEVFRCIDRDKAYHKIEEVLSELDTGSAAKWLQACFSEIAELLQKNVYAGALRWIEICAKYKFEGRKASLETLLSICISSASMRSSECFDAILTYVADGDASVYAGKAKTFADTALKAKEFDAAKLYYGKILSVKPDCVVAAQGKFFADIRCANEKELPFALVNLTDWSCCEEVLAVQTDEREVLKWIKKLADACIEHIGKAGESSNEIIFSVFEKLLSYIPIEYNDILLGLLRKVADICLQKGLFVRAQKYYEMYIGEKADDSAVYWGLLQAKLKCRNDDELVRQPQPIGTFDEFENAQVCSADDKTLLNHYIDVRDSQSKHIKAVKKRKRIIKIGAVALAAVILISAALIGWFTYYNSQSALIYGESNGGYVVSAGRFYNSERRLVIPAEVDGRAVVEIADNAFSAHEEIEELVLPASIQKIGANAFAGCVNLHTVTFIADGAARIASPQTALYEIGNGAFSGCGKLTSFELPYGLESIGGRAFAYTNLNEVTIPNTVDYIGEAAFVGCNALHMIIVGDRDEIPTEWSENWNDGCSASVEFRLRVIFDYSGATADDAVKEQYVLFGGEFTFPVPARAGYAFDGWFSGETRLTDGRGNSTENWQSVSGGVVTAKWAPNINRVVFNANGGSGVMPEQEIATDERATLSANTFTRKGYTFAGWAESATGSVVYNDGAEYRMGTDSSYELFAVWTANRNEVVFDGNGATGGIMESQYISTDASAILTENTFVKTGYGFVGWATSADGEAIFADGANYTMGAEAKYTLYAVWKTIDYTIKYNLNNGVSGENPSVYTIESGDIILKAPTRAGYRFTGWTGTGLSEPALTVTINMGSTGNREYTATWESNTNQIVFEANGGKGQMATQSIKTDEAAPLVSNSFTRDGYMFAGWATSADGEVEYSDGANYTMGTESEYTLYAVWKAVNYSISYELNGGVADGNPDLYTIESQSFTLNAPARTGYTFVGWTGTDIENATKVVTVIQGSWGDREYTAVWMANQNKIIFNVNGGEGEMPEQMILTDSSAPLTENVFTRAGYTFAGWATSPEGDVVYADCSDYLMGTESQYNLYAVWSPNLNNIIFDGNGADGGEMGDISAHTDEVIMLPENTYAKTGYTFIGWATEQNGEVAYEDGAQCTVGTEVAYTLYAVWAANEYLVTLDAVGGEVAEDAVAVKYDSAYQLPVPFRTGYAFIGWYDGTGESAVAYTDSQGNSLQNWTETYDKILYAKYTPNLNVIIFNANGGTGDMANATGYSDSDVRLPANNYTYNGYEFIGWSDSADGRVLYYDRDFYTMGTNSSYILYALWKPAKVDSDLNGYTAIYTAEDLDAIRNNLSGNYYLAADINLDGVEWEPIGTTDNPFTGTFDGCGHAILNMNNVKQATLHYNDRAIGIHATGSTATQYYYTVANYGAGLFGYNSGTIKNLDVIHLDITVQCSYNNNDVDNSSRRIYRYYAGGVCAYSSGVIENCYADGIILLNRDINNHRYSGGVVGSVGNRDNVLNCRANVSISSVRAGYLGPIFGDTDVAKHTEELATPIVESVNIIRYATTSGTYATQWVPGRSIVNLYSAVEKRDGYTFGGWALTEGGEKVYDAGDEFYFEEGQNEITLYPVWLPHKIVFDSNGGSGAMEALVVEPNTSVALPNCSFNSPSGFYFVGWSTEKGSEAEYVAGQQFTMPSEDIFTVTLYAVWAAIE